jgi:hypothetical protein
MWAWLQNSPVAKALHFHPIVNKDTIQARELKQTFCGISCFPCLYFVTHCSWRTEVLLKTKHIHMKSELFEEIYSFLYVNISALVTSCSGTRQHFPHWKYTEYIYKCVLSPVVTSNITWQSPQPTALLQNHKLLVQKHHYMILDGRRKRKWIPVTLLGDPCL